MSQPLNKTIKQFYRRQKNTLLYFANELNKEGEYKSCNCFDYYKCIFVHIPKTGGKSISKTLFGNLSGGHKEISGYKKMFGDRDFDRYFKFAFVRNPWDRLFSAYNYYRKGAIEYLADGKWKVEYLFYNENLSHLKNFEEFVMEWLDEKTLSIAPVHFTPQINFITLPENRNKIALDFLGRFENIQDDFNSLCKKLKRAGLKLQHTNVSNPNKLYTSVYTKEMIDKVAAMYAKDIDLLRYSYPFNKSNFEKNFL